MCRCWPPRAVVVLVVVASLVAAIVGFSIMKAGAPVVKAHVATAPYRCPAQMPAEHTLCKAMTLPQLTLFGFRISSFTTVVSYAPNDPVALEAIARKVLFETVVPTTRKHQADILTDKVRSKRVVWKPIVHMEPISAYWQIFGQIAEDMVLVKLDQPVDGEHHILDPGDAVVKVTMRAFGGQKVTTYAIVSRHSVLKFEFYLAWRAQQVLTPQAGH